MFQHTSIIIPYYLSNIKYRVSCQSEEKKLQITLRDNICISQCSVHWWQQNLLPWQLNIINERISLRKDLVKVYKKKLANPWSQEHRSSMTTNTSKTNDHYIWCSHFLLRLKAKKLNVPSHSINVPPKNSLINRSPTKDRYIKKVPSMYTQCR